jgi:nucleoside-triphosphatase
LQGLAARGARLAGFTTEEIRDRGRRRGFEGATLDGRRAVLADVSVRGTHRVGCYGVNLASFEEVVLEVLTPDPRVDLHVVDEIGKMECLSPRFVAAIRRLLEAGAPLLATVAERGGGLISEVKCRPGATLLQVTRSTREAIPDQVIGRLLVR